MTDKTMTLEQVRDWHLSKAEVHREVGYPRAAQRHQAMADAITRHLSHPAERESHPDDIAVDQFAEAMKAKLAEARLKGRGGWQDKEDCSQQLLSNMLRAHVYKGDPRDVANFCMFLHQRGEAIAPAERGESQEKAEPVAWMEPYEHGIVDATTKASRQWASIYTIPLYTAPPPAAGVPDARVVPYGSVSGEKDYAYGYEKGYADGWNACRTAMLCAAPEADHG